MSKEGFVNIHGKEYKTVAKRVQEFRSAYSGWSIMTDVVKIDDDQVLIKAQIINPESKIIATGHGHELRAASQINRTSYVENAETSAIGRALACLGLGGTEFASADEVLNAIHQQNSVKKPEKITPLAGAGSDLTEDVKQWVINEAIEIVADIESGNVEAAHDRASLITDQEQKMFLWSKLGSKERGAIKKYAESLKEKTNV